MEHGRIVPVLMRLVPFGSRYPKYTRGGRNLCTLDAATERTLEMAVRRLALSARAHDRALHDLILKVSLTIADLGGSEQIQAKHMANAVQ
jgi:predicted ATPase with chaperone activity